MRPGGGAHKGAEFERKVGVLLSLWLSCGEERNLFTRNEGSGARRTRTGIGYPGDLMAQGSEPLAHAFLARVMVECKHYARIYLEQFLYAPEKTALTAILIKAFEEAGGDGRECFVVVKENRRPALLFASDECGKALSAAAQGALYYHFFYKETIFMALLDEVLHLANPNDFLKRLGG